MNQTATLGTQASGLGNISMGYMDPTLIVVTWIDQKDPDNTEEYQFLDNEGNRFSLFRNVPTVLTKVQADLAQSKGATLLSIGAL